MACATVGMTGSGLAESPKMKMTTAIPESISTPDKLETSIGTLEFFDGVPTQATVETAYDFLEKAHGMKLFLSTLPSISVHQNGPTEPWIEGKWRPSNVDLVK